jgi:hypothetical protein
MTYDAPKENGKTGAEAIHAQALEIFELCVENEAENRKEALDDLRFARLGEQWDPKVQRTRELEGRPCLTVNKMPAFIRQVVNDARQNKPAIVVHPVDDNADPDTAEVIEGLIRNIEQSSNAEVAYDTALDFAVSAGWGYIRVNTQYTSDDTFEQDLVIEPVADPMTIYGDPYDNGPDSSKWNHAFVVRSVPKEEFERQYKGKDGVDWDHGPYATLPNGWMVDNCVVVAEYWCREVVERQIVALSDGSVVPVKEYEDERASFEAAGIKIVGQPRSVNSHKVTQHIMSGAEILETVSWAGRYIPIIPVYGEDLTVEGRRFLRSMVRDAKDSQRRVNFHTSAVTELVALAPKAPFIGEEGAFDVDPNWQTANSESHAYLEYKTGKAPPQRQPFAGVPAGEMQQVLLASDDMKAIMGLHDASLGMRSNETSGKAINARKIEGDVSTFNFTDNLSRAIRHVGRVIIDMIPEVYSVPRIVRVMGQDGAPRKVAINGAQPPATQASDPAALKAYDLMAGKYDLVVKVGPSFTSRREEAAAEMTELIRSYPAAAPLIGDLLVKNLDWPGADEVAERLKAMLPPQVQGQAQQVPADQARAAVQQVTQQAQQVAQQLQAAQAELQQLKADKALEAQKLNIEAYKAQTERLAAEAEARRPYAPEPASATTL